MKGNGGVWVEPRPNRGGKGGSFSDIRDSFEKKVNEIGATANGKGKYVYH